MHSKYATAASVRRMPSKYATAASVRRNNKYSNRAKLSPNLKTVKPLTDVNDRKAEKPMTHTSRAKTTNMWQIVSSNRTAKYMVQLAKKLKLNQLESTLIN